MRPVSLNFAAGRMTTISCESGGGPSELIALSSRSLSAGGNKTPINRPIDCEFAFDVARRAYHWLWAHDVTF